MRMVRRASLVAVALSLLWAAGSARAVDPKLFPNDTEFVLRVNLKQIMESELVKAQKEFLDQAKGLLEQRIGDNPGQKYLKEAGFDPLKDLHAVTVAGPGSKDLNQGCIILEGRFEPAKFNAAVEKAAKDSPDLLKVSKAGNASIYEISPPGERQVFAALAGETTLIVTPTKEALMDALARAQGTKRSNMKKEFKALLETLTDKQSIGVAATGAALGKLMENSNDPNAAAAAQLVQTIEGLSGAITIRKDIQFQLGVNAADEATAKQMAQLGNGGLFAIRNMAAAKAKEDEKFAPLVDIAKTLRLSTQGSNILLRGEVSLDVIEKLMKNLPQ